MRKWRVFPKPVTCIVAIAVVTIQQYLTTYTLRVYLYTGIQVSNPGNTVLNHAISQKRF